MPRRTALRGQTRLNWTEAGQFSIDYSKLAKDPNADSSGAGYLYAPGRPVAAWS
jgi:hypothetical protein